MIVDVLKADPELELPERAFLKLHDRRFADDYRKQWDAEVWTPEVERDLLEWSRSGEAKAFLAECAEPESESEEDEEEDEEEWDAVKIESYLFYRLREEHQTETKVYGALQEHQGVSIPKRYSAISMHIGPEGEPLGESPELFEVHGILIEYLDGFRASETAQHADRSDWGYLVNRAAKLVGHMLDKANVRNTDVRPANMMVCPDEAAERGYRLVMIDFGHCVGREKHRQDEEGAMGCIMEIQLARVGFEANYKRPLTWIEFAERE